MSNWCCRGMARDRQYDNCPSYFQIRLQLKKRLMCRISVWWFPGCVSGRLQNDLVCSPIFGGVTFCAKSRSISSWRLAEDCSDWTIDWLESSSWMLFSKKLRTPSSFTSSSSAIVFLLLLRAIAFRPQVQLLWSSWACRGLVHQDPETVDALVYHVLWYNVLKSMCIY